MPFCPHYINKREKENLSTDIWDNFEIQKLALCPVSEQIARFPETELCDAEFEPQGFLNGFLL